MKGKDPKVVRKSPFFRRAIRVAQEALRDPVKLHQLLNAAVAKILTLRKENKEFDRLLMKVGTSIRMAKAYKNKQYTQMPWRSLVLIIGGLVYFVMPLDLIPDFLPVVGFLDDATIMIWIFGALRKDIEAFEEWEINNLNANADAS
jgi:uncharacterized membrane protein YkvA (DUF1232 family)